MLTIVLMKWRPITFGSRRVGYTADHVNKVINMVNRHLTIEHEFICFTDDPEGVECQTLSMPAPELMKYGDCWHRLWLFSEEAKKYGDRFVSMDLDTVIVDSLDHLFTDHDFIIGANTLPQLCGPYSGAIFTLKAGTNTHVWEEFNPRDLRKTTRIERYKGYRHPRCDEAGIKIGTDQGWFSVTMPYATVWGDEEGIMSYRFQARGEEAPPIGTCFINFHGTDDPSLRHCQQESPWIMEHWR